MKPLAKALDRLFFGLVARRIKPSLRALDKESIDLSPDPAVLDGSESFYARPEAIPTISESLTLVKRRSRYDVYDFQFPSAATSPWPENNIVYGRYFKTTRTPDAPTVIVLHGWLAFSYLWFATICRKLAEAGINGLMIQLPYHMRRQPRHSRYSGEYTITGDLTRWLGTIRQSVADTQSVVSWLTSNHTPHIGVWGVSLGGWIGALATAVESRLDGAVLMIPAVRPDEIMWHSELCAPLKAVLVSAGIPYEQVQEVLKSATPKYFRPLLPPEKILLIEAEMDLVVSPHAVEELWETWGRPHLRRYPHSHISIIFAPRVLDDGVNFIRGAIGGEGK